MQSFYDSNPESPELFREFFALGPWFHRAVFALWRAADDGRVMNDLIPAFGPQFSTYTMVAPWHAIHAEVECIPKFFSAKHIRKHPHIANGVPKERVVRIAKKVWCPDDEETRVLAYCVLKEEEIFLLDRQR